MIYKDNGDVYFGRIRVWNAFRQSPPRWLMMLGASSALFLGWVVLQGFARLVSAVWF